MLKSRSLSKLEKNLHKIKILQVVQNKMVREVKFRVWDDTNDKFIDDKESQVELNHKDNQLTHFSDHELEQFTGLRDKNGKEIYEGDIVLIEHPCWTERTIVKFIDGCFMLEQVDPVKGHEKTIVPLHKIKFGNWSLDIIGNIHENPELLKD